MNQTVLCDELLFKYAVLEEYKSHRFEAWEQTIHICLSFPSHKLSIIFFSVCFAFCMSLFFVFFFFMCVFVSHAKLAFLLKHLLKFQLIPAVYKTETDQEVVLKSR